MPVFIAEPATRTPQMLKSGPDTLLLRLKHYCAGLVATSLLVDGAKVTRLG